MPRRHRTALRSTARPSAALVSAGLLAVAAVLTGCETDPSEAAGTATSEGADADDLAGLAADGDEGANPLQVEVLDGRIVLHGVDDDVVTVPAEGDAGVDEGEAVHAVIRPGDHDPTIVLALFRVEEPEPEPRYELRYLAVDEDGPSDLYWFPWRLQVDARVAEVLDVPPLPVWSPDGRVLAWIEWNGIDTTLRMVGWHDGTGSNPSDAVAAYRLPDVAPGTQLEAWEQVGEATVVFSARSLDGEDLVIELDVVELALTKIDI